jgi:hypothetical protein
MMKKLISPLAAMVLATSFALPLNATPIVVPKAVPIHAADVELVKDKSHGNGYAYGHSKRRYADRDCRYDGNCYSRPYGYRSYPSYYGYPRHYGGYPDYNGYQRRSGVTVYFDF